MTPILPTKIGNEYDPRNNISMEIYLISQDPRKSLLWPKNTPPTKNHHDMKRSVNNWKVLHGIRYHHIGKSINRNPRNIFGIFL